MTKTLDLKLKTNMNFKLIILAVVVVILIVIAVGYLFINLNQPVQQGGGQQQNVQQKTVAPLTDTANSILNDLKQIPDDSSVDKTMESFDKTLEEF